MAKPEKKEKAAKAPKTGRNNMESTRKDYDKVYAEALKEGPEVAATVAKYFTMLSNSMSNLGWKPKPVETTEPTPAPEPTEPTPVDNAEGEAGTNTED